MNGVSFSITVLDAKGNPLGQEGIADLRTFQYYEWLLKNREAVEPGYTIHFGTRNGGDGFFRVSAITDVQFPSASPSISPSASKEIQVKVKVAFFVDKPASSILQVIF